MLNHFLIVEEIKQKFVFDVSTQNPRESLEMKRTFILLHPPLPSPPSPTAETPWLSETMARGRANTAERLKMHHTLREKNIWRVKI